MPPHDADEQAGDRQGSAGHPSRAYTDTAPTTQPHPQRQQHGRGQEAKLSVARCGVDPKDGADCDARHGADQQLPGQPEIYRPGSPVSEQCSWGGHEVVQQVGGCHRRTGHPQKVELHREEEHRTRHPHRSGHHCDDTTGHERQDQR